MNQNGTRLAFELAHSSRERKPPAVMVKIGSWVHGTIAHDWAGALTSYSLINRV